VFEGGVGGCVKYRTPSLLNVGGGTLLAFTQCRQVSHADASPQEIHMKKSLNDGRTWGPATVLPFAADPLHNSLHRAQTVFDVQSRAVFLFDDALPYPTTKHNDTNGGCIVRVWRSPDLGTSWVRTLLRVAVLPPASVSIADACHDRLLTVSATRRCRASSGICPKPDET
jgi:hypothetical protein